MKRSILCVLMVIAVILIAVPLFAQDVVTSFSQAPLPEKIAYILSFLAPLIAQGIKLLIQKYSPAAKKRTIFLTVLILSVAVGVISASISGLHLSMSNIIEWVTGTFAWTQTAWAFWKKFILDE